jgi:hypothetical protein
MRPPSLYFQASVSLQPRMHQMPLCTPKNKNVDQRSTKSWFMKQQKTIISFSKSYQKRHEGSSFPIVTFVPIRLQTYASIGIMQSVVFFITLEMAKAPVRIQHCIFRIQLDRLYQNNYWGQRTIYTLLLQSQTRIMMFLTTLEHETLKSMLMRDVQQYM